jgi:hypothetical protein
MTKGKQDFLNSTRRSVSWFKQVHDSHKLTVKPPFQRNPVWTEAQKSYLIDTILKGYPIPELYVQETVDENGSERHTIVDGQQRVRACLEFIEGSFALTPAEVPDYADLKFEELGPEQRKQIYAYNFIVRQLPEVPDEELRIIFQRLNRNVVALNRQELRHATYWGEFISSMERISDLDYWTTSGVFTANDIRRMLDVEFVSEIVVARIHGLQNKKAALDKWYEVYEQSYPPKDQIESEFQIVLGEFAQIMPDLTRTRWRKKSDFYTLYLVFANHVDKLPLSKSGRAKASKKLRDFGNAVDTFISLEKGGGALVHKYARAVERAASDLASRTARAQALEAVLADCW